jgi:tetratricopeptide (TPR) repeat protein
MMKRATYCGLVVACVFAAAEVSAQKYPERRTARQGTVLYHNGDFAGAEERYRRALELNPELREASFNLGDALWRQAVSQAAENADGSVGGNADGNANGQAAFQGAVDAWTGIAADSLAPSGMVSAANYNIGNAALAGRQIDAAIEAYKQALRIRPDDMQAKYNLAYAQKMQQQQNDDQDKDDQGGGGGNDQNDQNDQNENDQNGDGQNDLQDDNGDRDGDNGNDGNEPPPPSGEDGGAPKMDPRAAEQMLDAMQAAENDTREKVNAKEVQAGARSGKNW